MNAICRKGTGIMFHEPIELHPEKVFLHNLGNIIVAFLLKTSTKMSLFTINYTDSLHLPTYHRLSADSKSTCFYSRMQKPVGHHLGHLAACRLTGLGTVLHFYESFLDCILNDSHWEVDNLYWFQSMITNFVLIPGI